MALRHEWKHRIDTAGLLALRARLGAVLQRDPHALGGSYQVRMKDENTDFREWSSPPSRRRPR